MSVNTVLVPVVVAMTVPLRSMSYPAIPEMSVDLVQLSATCVEESALAVRPTGTLGGEVSTVQVTVVGVPALGVITAEWAPSDNPE